MSDFGDFYEVNRSKLFSQARRILKDDSKADEIVQDAVMRFLLAAPELSSQEHALAYLHRSIENACVDHFRATNKRPLLVVLDEASAEVEAQWQKKEDIAEELSRAEDAAIIRQALSLLSPAERAALVMWEIDGRSTEEIAAELGIKSSAVRHTVSRARASLRKILSTLVIDEKNGLTALELISTTYKKASELAQKSGRVAMSLVLLVAAFLGFNSLTGSESIQTVINTQVSENSGAKAEAVTEIVDETSAQVATTPESKPSSLSPKEVADELAFYNAQLGTAAAMLEAMSLLEGKE